MHALFDAVSKEDVIQCLADGCDINQQWNDQLWRCKRTPLIYHCMKSNIEVVCALLDNNCDVKASDLIGNTAFSIVCKNGDSKLLRAMLKFPAMCEVATYDIACRNGIVDVFDILVEHNIDWNKRGEHGILPLVYAINSNSIDIIDRLLNLGADVNVIVDGVTPIFHCRSVEVLHKLFIHGANLKARDDNGRTLLHYCGLPYSTIYALLYYTMFINVTSDFSTDILSALIDYGLDINAVDNTGRTPIMIASYLGMDGAVDIFTRAGAILPSDYSEKRQCYDE